MRYRTMDKTELKALKLNFDDIVKDDDGTWSQICPKCIAKLKIPDNMISECPSECICGVIGCNKQADYYLDFK